MKHAIKINQTENYKLTLKDVPELDTLVKELVTEAGKYDVNRDITGEIEEVECLSRDGFIASRDNHGGYMWRGFTYVGHIVGSGCYPANKSARKEIERQHEYNRKLVKEEHPELAQDSEEFYERLDEYTTDETSSIMYEVRIMYNGVDERGTHTFSVSAVVNTEGPYHRSSIPWSSYTCYKCEHGSEVEISGRTVKSIERKLRAALKKVIGENL